MIVRRNTGDLNKIYRPCRISEIVGHDTIKRTISNALSKQTLPHSLLFTGLSGCGKTTAARIIAMGLNCAEGISGEPCCVCPSCKSILNLNSFAVIETDAARTSDVSTIRSIIDDLPAAPMGGERFKIAIFDEAHNLSGKAEDALLKFLEDTPSHVYIILCTNESQKLKIVTKNRCKVTQFGRLTNIEIYNLLEQVCQFEGFNYNSDILKYISTESNGVPRQALSYLQQINAEESWTKEAASLIINAGADIESAEVFGLCKVMLNSNFKEVLNYYNKVKNVPIETIRIITTGFFTGCLKNSRSPQDATKYSKIIDIISVPYYGPKPENILINNFFKITQILRGN